MMKKSEWQNLYNELYKLHNEFQLVYPSYKSGKNEKIRDEAEKKINNLLHTVDYHLGKNHDAYKLLTGGDNNIEYGRTIIFHELLEPRYFSRDMFNFLEQIKVKIDNTD